MIMKSILWFSLLGVVGVPFCYGKSYKITEEAEAMEVAKKEGRAIAYVFG